MLSLLYTIKLDSLIYYILSFYRAIHRIKKLFQFLGTEKKKECNNNKIKSYLIVLWFTGFPTYMFFSLVNIIFHPSGLGQSIVHGRRDDNRFHNQIV
jgi:hypothetical protein